MHYYIYPGNDIDDYRFFLNNFFTLEDITYFEFTTQVNSKYLVSITKEEWKNKLERFEKLRIIS